MSSTCANCSCADKTNCQKGNGNSMTIVETVSYVDTFVMDAPAAEHDGKCKCGANCSCTTCTCGH
uniref:Metallothionein n=1 Tax=Kalanchoe fedtschenkoi TaxID=63787 RepID=A0A7N0RE47_KALFE